MSERLQVNFAGLKIEHPIIAASAGTTKDAERSFRAQEAGFSAVILKSVQEEVVNRYVPFPRFYIVKSGTPGYSSVSFLSYEQAYEGDINDYAETIAETKKRLTIPVIASINCTEPDSWYKYAEMVEQAGADALEIVPSCPAGIFMRQAAEFYPIASEALKSVKKHVKIPVGVKMTQQMSSPIACATALEQDGADWITMFNRTPGLYIDIDTMSPIMHRCACGHGGPWAAFAIARWIAYTYPHIKVPISATGGITNWEDVIRYILAGASTVQIASLLYMKGYNVVHQMIKSIEEYLDEKGLASIAELQGKASDKLQTLEEADKSYRYYAQVNEELCISCKKCKDICIYDAIDYSGTKPKIDKDLCDGCGLCAQICNRAITMKKNCR